MNSQRVPPCSAREPRSDAISVASDRGELNQRARHDRLIAPEAGHYFPHDLGHQCWCGADHGLPFSITDGTIKTIFCPACTAKAFPPGVGRITKLQRVEHGICNDAADQSGTVVMIGVGGGVSLPFLFVHAPRSGEQISPSQAHKF